MNRYWEVTKLLRANTGGKRLSNVFDDFIEMTALAFRNAIDPIGHHDRELRYLKIADQYTPDQIDRFAHALALVTSPPHRRLEATALGVVVIARHVVPVEAQAFDAPTPQHTGEAAMRGWSMSLSELRAAIADLPDDYEVGIDGAEVADCEIADLHVDRKLPPAHDHAGLLVLRSGQQISYEYDYHPRLDVDLDFGQTWDAQAKAWKNAG